MSRFSTDSLGRTLLSIPAALAGFGLFIAACGSPLESVDTSAASSEDGDEPEADDFELLYAGGTIVNDSGLTGEPAAAVAGSLLTVFDRADGAELVGIGSDSPALDFALTDYQDFHQTYTAAIEGDPDSIAAVAAGPKTVALDLERDLAAVRRDAALGVTDLTYARFPNPLKIQLQDDSLTILDCVEQHVGSNAHQYSSFLLHEARLRADGDRWFVEEFAPVGRQDALSDHDYGCVPGIYGQAALDAMPELLGLIERFWSDPQTRYEELQQRVWPVDGQRQLDEFAFFADSGMYLEGVSSNSIRVRGSVEGASFPLIAVQVCTESPAGLVARWSDTGEQVGGDAAFQVEPGSIALREFLLVVDVAGDGGVDVGIGRLWSETVGGVSCDG